MLPYVESIAYGASHISIMGMATEVVAEERTINHITQLENVG